MKLHTVSPSLLTLWLVLAALPAMAQQYVYDNGPVNGQIDAWTLNFGFAVTDSFNDDSRAPITGLSFWAWLVPGDTISSIQVSIGSVPYGTNLFNSVVNPTQENCFNNDFGYNVCLESANFNGPTVSSNAWLTLQNASVPSGDPVYWDENSGQNCMSPGCPSRAMFGSVGSIRPTAVAGIGSIPSEAFTLYGMNVFTTTTSASDTASEPGSIMLFGSGILGLASILRRKLF